MRMNKLPEAVAIYREAIRLAPLFSDSHHNLGIVLWQQDKLAEARVAFEEAIRLKPDYFLTHYNLGLVLGKQNRLADAAASYREAIRLNPDYPEAHCNLAGILRLQGKFTESLAAISRGHALGSKTRGWPYPSALWLRQVRRLVELDRKLPTIFKGTDHPSNSAEQLELARVCSLKRWYATSARFYADAFAAAPALPEDASAEHRYDAACAAALAACDQGTDRPRPDKERSRLRRQALGWLRELLISWMKRLDRNTPQDRIATSGALRHWQQDADLAGVRDSDALKQLPEDERQQWQTLWADVQALHKRAGGK
jgi:tetratricopeptide (TPR) repeat protein